MPKVSVIVPNYNHSAFLELRLESIFNQTFHDFEVILLDDCSTDNSVEILSEYAKNPKVSHFIVNKRNSGTPFKQWKKGIDLAQGEFIWIAESDDWVDIKFLEVLVNAINKDDEIVMAYSAINRMKNEDTLIDTFGVWSQNEAGNRWKNSFISNGTYEIENFPIIGTNIPNASSVLFRQEKVLPFYNTIQSYTCAGDWAFWVNLMYYGKISYISEPLSFFRWHGDNTTIKSKNKGTDLIETIRIFKLLTSFTENNSSKKKALTHQLISEWKKKFFHLSFLNNTLIGMYLIRFDFKSIIYLFVLLKNKYI